MDAPPVDAFVVRKATKQHGMQKLIEGPEVAGRDRARRRGHVDDRRVGADGRPRGAGGGATVVGVATVVDRATGAQEAIETEGVPYRALLGLADLGLG